MPYSIPEIIGALDALSDERYYFRLVSPAIGAKERKHLREWSIKMALLANAVASRAERGPTKRWRLGPLHSIREYAGRRAGLHR